MSDDQNWHVTLTYKRTPYSYNKEVADFSLTFAVNEDIARDFRAQTLTDKELEVQLTKRGCHLVDWSNGPGAVWRYSDGTTEEFYYRDGKIHRDDGPAWIFRYADGSVLSEEYYRDGKIHRDDGPAWSFHTADGSVWREDYYRNDKLHREGGPARIIGMLSPEGPQEEYFRDGKYHREDGPAIIRHNSGRKCLAYYRDGKPYPANGPAYFEIMGDGTVVREDHYRNGKFVGSVDPRQQAVIVQPQVESPHHRGDGLREIKHARIQNITDLRGMKDPRGAWHVDLHDQQCDIKGLYADASQTVYVDSKQCGLLPQRAYSQKMGVCFQVIDTSSAGSSSNSAIAPRSPFDGDRYFGPDRPKDKSPFDGDRYFGP